MFHGSLISDWALLIVICVAVVAASAGSGDSKSPCLGSRLIKSTIQEQRRGADRGQVISRQPIVAKDLTARAVLEKDHPDDVEQRSSVVALCATEGSGSPIIREGHPT